VFVGGFTLDSAQAVCGGEGMSDVLEGVSSLLEKSLVVRQGRPDVEPRFRMLETVREYAEDRLEQSGKAQDTKLRMAQYFAAVAEQAAVGLTTPDHRVWLSRLEAELDNMRAAISFTAAHDKPELFLRLAVLPWFYWWPRGYFPEFRPLLERCFTSYPSLDPASRALQLWGVGFARNVSGDTKDAIPLAQELMELERARGDEHGLALAQWGYCSMSQVEPICELRAILTEAAATLRRLGDHAATPFALATLGLLALSDGDPLEAERLGQEALQQARALDSEATIGVVLFGLGYSALARRDDGLAWARFADSAEMFRRIRDREGLAYTLDGLAAVALAQGRPELAAKAVGAADATRERIGVTVYPITQRAFRGPLLSAIQAALGAAAFEAARMAGTETDLEEAIEELLRLTASARTAQPSRRER
jgi:tetratricopeptide (TPR) repeat protein